MSLKNLNNDKVSEEDASLLLKASDTSVLRQPLHKLIDSTAYQEQVDADYLFGGRSLRSKEPLNCEQSHDKSMCQKLCGRKSGLCFEEKCYCVHKPDINTQRLLTVSDNTWLKYRPSLRHHVAHFCPNLDIARDCIRKCMDQGKPAFCGKDHVCYCGHEYTPNDIPQKQSAAQIKNEFYDLYKKYFGPRNSEVTDETN